MMIIGTSGAGKSTLMNSIITEVIQNYSHNNVGMIFIDTKGVEFNIYNELGRTPKHVEDYAGNDEEWIEETLLKISLLVTNRKNHNIGGKPYIVFVDEFQIILETMPRCAVQLKWLIDNSYKYGVYIVMSSQSDGKGNYGRGSYINLEKFPIRCVLRMHKDTTETMIRYMGCTAPIEEEQKAGIVYVRDYTKEFDIKKLHFKFRSDTYIRKVLKVYGK